MPLIFQVFFFDIDGTLVSTGGAGRSAMDKAFREVHGVEGALGQVSMAGRVDPAIYREAVDRFGFEPAPAAFQSAYFRHLGGELTRFGPLGRLLPGVDELLRHLAGLPEVMIGLLTGNWRRGAFLKLEHFGVSGYFDFGAFGDDADDRNALPAVAIARFEKRARERLAAGVRYHVIGDTPSDIQCARVGRCRSIGVATGEFSLAELARHHPDLLLPDFTDLPAFCRAVGLAAPLPAAAPLLPSRRAPMVAGGPMAGPSSLGSEVPE